MPRTIAPLRHFRQLGIRFERPALIRDAFMEIVCCSVRSANPHRAPTFFRDALSVRRPAVCITARLIHRGVGRDPSQPHHEETGAPALTFSGSARLKLAADVAMLPPARLTLARSSGGMECLEGRGGYSAGVAHDGRCPQTFDPRSSVNDAPSCSGRRARPAELRRADVAEWRVHARMKGDAQPVDDLLHRLLPRCKRYARLPA